MIALGVEHGKDNRLVVDHLVEHAMRKPSQAGPAPVAKADAVAERVFSNQTVGIYEVAQSNQGVK